MSKRINLNDFPIHPAAELFPMMSETEFQEMKEDIRLHGQSDDILMWNGQLLDGRNRLRACTELGIEPSWIELELSLDPVVWVLSHNLHRRHLTTSQRAMVADKLAILLFGDNQHKKEGASIDAPSQAEAAEKMHVSRKSVQRARKVRKTASKKVIEAVERGEMSLNAALETTKQSEAEKAAKAAERAAVKAAKEAEKAAAKAAREQVKAAKAAEKTAREKAKADAKAAKEAARQAALTTEGQITAIKNLINQHLGKIVRHLDDLNGLKPNRAALNINLKACEGIKLW